MKKMKLRFQTKSKLESRLKYFNDDNLMDVCQKQFLKQQEQLFDLQNKLRSFIRGIMEITNTIDNMYSSFKGIYEPHWIGNVEFNHMCQESVKIWRQFVTDFKCNISKSIDDYGEEYSDMKRQIDKRNKKLTELNKQRLVYENYRNAKRIDEIKLKKAESEMKSIDNEYQTQNNGLKETLPTFCDKRIRIYVDMWTRLFEAEEAMFTFLKEGRKYHLGILSKLAGAVDTGQYNIKSQVTTINGGDSNLLSTKAYAQSAMTLVHPELRQTVTIPFEHGSLSDINKPNAPLPPVVDIKVKDNSELNRAKSYQLNSRLSLERSEVSNTNFFSIPHEKVPLKKRISFNENSEVTNKPTEDVKLSNHTKIPTKPRPNTRDTINISDASEADVDEYDTYQLSHMEEQDILSTSYDDNSQRNTSYRVLQEIESYFQVVAEFDYEGQDEDELDLTKDDIILVLPWDNEEQMEDGWLYGENVITKKKGLFPENHTTRLDP